MQKFPKQILLKYLSEDLDFIISIMGIFFGISIISLYLFISKTIHLLTLGFALTLASSIYLIIKNREVVPNDSIQKTIKNLFEIIFFLLFSLSLLVLLTHEDRPLLYFILIALCTGFTALSI